MEHVLNNYKDEMIARYESGATLEEIAEEFGFARDSVRIKFLGWGVLERTYVEPDPDTLEKAPQPKHRHETVKDPETGKIYYDITDYITDCGV